MSKRGMVGADGRSALPAGIVDYADGTIDPEVQARLAQIVEEGKLDVVKAKYKLEIAFNDERSTLKPYTGIVSAWSNGGFIAGGGDESIYFCPQLVEKNGQTRTCSEPLDLRWIGKDAAVCPSCRRAIKPVDLVGQVGYRLTTQGWADLITRMWMRLGCDADIRMGVMAESLRRRTEAVKKQESLSAGDKLDDARLKRHWAIYPLKNILKDTQAGADLQNRIKAFLSS